MGCGESKHAVGVENTISKSMSRSRKQEKRDAVAAEKPINVTADAVSDSSNSNMKKNNGEGKEAKVAEKIDEEEPSKVVEEAADVAVVQESREQIKTEKIEEVKADQEEVAAAVILQEEEEEEEIKDEEKDHKVEITEGFEVVDEKNDEIKIEEEDDEEEKQEVVAPDESSSVEEIISEGENEGKGYEGKEEGLEVDESKELAPTEETKQPSVEEKKTADQNEEANAPAAAAEPLDDEKDN